MNDLEQVRRNPGPAILTAAVGVLVGVLLGATVFNGDGGAASTSPPAGTVRTAEVDGQAPPRDGDRGGKTKLPPEASGGSNGTAESLGATGRAPGAIEVALDHAVVAARPKGSLELAVWAEGWSAPAVSPKAALNARSRMWSMSKALTAIALLRLHETKGTEPERDVLAAIAAALRRSENCRQRRVVLALQEAAESPQGAVAVIRGVLKQAGIDPDSVVLPSEPKPPDSPQCAPILGELNNRPALQFGTAEWRVSDGAAFGRALAAGAFGATGVWVREQMAAEKGRSTDPGVTKDDYTVPSFSWGAGNAFGQFDGLAYKGGWGGADRGDYLVAQVVSMQVGGLPVGVMGVFRPAEQPTAGDDPGKTSGPAELERAFKALAPVLRKQIAGR